MRGNAVLLAKKSTAKDRYMLAKDPFNKSVQPNIPYLNLPAKCKPLASKMNFKRSDKNRQKRDRQQTKGQTF